MRAPIAPSWAPPLHPTTSQRPPPTPPHSRALSPAGPSLQGGPAPPRFTGGNWPSTRGGASGHRPNTSAGLPRPSLQVWKLALPPQRPISHSLPHAGAGSMRPCPLGPARRGVPCVCTGEEPRPWSARWRALLRDSARGVSGLGLPRPPPAPLYSVLSCERWGQGAAWGHSTHLPVSGELWEEAQERPG